MKTKISDQLKIAVLGDIHLGHRQTPSIEIIDNLLRAFPDTDETGTLDMILIEGDVFETALYLHNDHFGDIHFWIMNFLKMCKKRDIIVRVLEGTPRHDWKQSHLFGHINRNYDIDADLRYVDTLSVEINDRIGMSILYVPDEWDIDPLDTYRKARLLLTEHELEQFDIILMHGAFDYQLPSHIAAPTHDSEQWQSIVKYFIFVGHVHRHSQKGKIVAAGSFDRLSHGEEEDKGHVVATITNGCPEIMFIPNVNAKTYKTIDITGMDLDTAINAVEDGVKGLRPYSRVRVLGSEKDPVANITAFGMSTYPDFQWAKKIDDREKKAKNVEISMAKRFAAVDLRAHNLPTLLRERMISFKIPDEQIDKAIKILEQVL